MDSEHKFINKFLFVVTCYKIFRQIPLYNFLLPASGLSVKGSFTVIGRGEWFELRPSEESGDMQRTAANTHSQFCVRLKGLRKR
jgi:hypothetical protein